MIMRYVESTDLFRGGRTIPRTCKHSAINIQQTPTAEFIAIYVCASMSRVDETLLLLLRVL
jgi:hypothetical protein